MLDTRNRFPLVAAALLFSGLVACSSAAPSKGGWTGGAGGGTGGAMGGTGGAGGAILGCWPDPKVIKICHQLENACENCGPTKAVACQNGKYPKVCACFELINKAYAGMATDAD